MKANNNMEEKDLENTKEDKMSNGEKQKNRAQVYNPVTGRWVKFNTKHGGIIDHKHSKGPFKNVKKYRKKKR